MFNTYGGGPVHPGGYSTHVLVHKLNILLEVTIADVISDKLETAQTYGANNTILWQKKFANFDDYMAEVRKTTQNDEYTFDATIDFVGLPDTFNVAYRSVRVAGTIISVGLYGGIVDLPLIELVAKKLHIQGNYVGTLADMKALVELLKDKNVQYPTVEFTNLDNINETFDRLRKGQVTGRAIVKF